MSGQATVDLATDSSAWHGRQDSDRRQLARNLLAIGRRTGGPRRIGALRWALLLSALLALTWALIGVLLTHAVYDHRAEITRERTPVHAADGPVRWAAAASFVGEHQVALIALDTVDGAIDAALPLPPGVPAWPEPGQAVVSPALAEVLERLELPDRYGHVVGTVADDALASPSELIAYVRPPRALTEANSERITSFGVSRAEQVEPFTGEVLYDRDERELWALALLLLGVPGVLALAAASRVTDTAARRRHLLLTRLGAGACQRSVIALPPAATAATTSAGVSLAALVWFAGADRRLPFTHFVLDATVVRGQLPFLLAATVVTSVIGAVAAAWMTAGRIGRQNAVRLTTPRDRPARARTAALLLIIAVHPWVVGRSGHPLLVTLATFAAAATVILCLPGAMADGVRGYARRRAPRALADEKTGHFVAWRMTSARPRAMARLAGAMTGLVVIVAHAVVILGMFLAPGAAITQTAARVGDSVAFVPVANDDAGATVAAGLSLAADHDLAAIRLDQYVLDERVELIATCPDLNGLGIGCKDGRLPPGAGPSWLHTVTAWYSGQTVDVVATNPATHRGETEQMSASLLLVADPAGGDVDIDELSRDAYLAAKVPIAVDRMLGPELRGADDLADKSSWVYVFGLPGAVALLLVSTLAWAAVTIEETQNVLASPILADQPPLLDAIATIRIALPVLLGGLAGVAISAWLLWPHTSAQQTALPWNYLTIVTICTMLTAAAAGVLGRRLLGRHDRNNS